MFNFFDMHAEREMTPLYPVPKFMTVKELGMFYYQIANWSTQHLQKTLMVMMFP